MIYFQYIGHIVIFFYFYVWLVISLFIHLLT